MKKTIFWGVVLVIMASCAGPKQLRYLQDIRDGEVLSQSPAEAYHLQAGDRLTIRVTSYDRSAVAPFNVQDAQMHDVPFIIDEQGTIAYPGVGTVNAAGLTVDQLAATLQSHVAQMAKGAVVRVELVGASVSVLGEVARPTRIGWHQPGITLYEALAEAGDLRSNASREVIILRKQADGVKTYVVDLRSKDGVSATAWMLLPGDVVYVAPRRGRLIYGR